MASTKRPPSPLDSVTVAPPKALGLLGMGVVCALGNDAVAAAAAARAGLCRPQPLPMRAVVDAETSESEPIIGHPAGHLTLGFAGTGRLAQLGALALADLARRLDPRQLAAEETAAVLAFGSGYFRNAAEVAEDGGAFDAGPPPDSEPVAEEREVVRAQVIPRMFQLAKVPRPGRVEALFADQAGFGLALARAAQLLEQPGIRRCLVGGIDSYCDPDALDALLALGLLATPQEPVGLSPGEGAAVLLFERPGSTGIRLSALDYRAGGVHLLDPAGAGRCRVLAQVIGHSLEMARTSRCGLAIGTHNGTSGAAAEWGRALMAVPRFGAPGRHWFPAVSLGDTGAAAAALATCFGAQALSSSRDDASTLVWASSPGGGKTAFVLGRS